MSKWRKATKFQGSEEKDLQMPRCKENIAKQQRICFPSFWAERIRLTKNKRERKDCQVLRDKESHLPDECWTGSPGERISQMILYLFYFLVVKFHWLQWERRRQVVFNSTAGILLEFQ